MFKNDNEFDINKLQSPQFREYFEQVQLRMDEVSQSIVAGYGLPTRFDSFRAFIAHDLDFNAQAFIQEKTACVSINASVVLGLRIIFDKLFTQIDILPKLNNDDPEQIISYESQFVLDTDKPFDWSQLTISLPKQKYQASGVLSDLCISFIYLHEFGHWLCGHVEAVEAIFAQSAITEFRRKHTDHCELRQYWEYQADAIAAALLSQYIETFIKHITTNQTWLLEATDLHANQSQQIAVHATAMVIAALHVTFLYMEACKFKEHKFSFHPPAQARVMYLKDIIAKEVSARFHLAPEQIVLTYFNQYFASFVSSLDDFGLAARHGFDDDYLDSIEQVIERLVNSHDKLAPRCREWSWLPVEQWANPQAK